jgi:hypothetical protein
MPGAESLRYVSSNVRAARSGQRSTAPERGAWTSGTRRDRAGILLPGYAVHVITPRSTSSRRHAKGLIANVGLVLPATLAQRLGLPELLLHHGRQNAVVLPT